MVIASGGQPSTVRRTMSRRANVFAASGLVAILALSLLFVGCGDKEQPAAGDMLNKADKYLEGLDSDIDELSEDLESLRSSLKEGETLTSSLLCQVSAPLKRQAADIMAELASTRDRVREWAAESALEARWVPVRREMLENSVELEKVIRDVFIRLSQVDGDLASGRVPVADELDRTVDDWTVSFDRIRARNRELERRAEALSSD